MYDTYKPELCEEFLEHHQILGAHWGEMHGPPYPLDSSVSTGSRLKKGSMGKGSVKKKKSSGGLMAKHKAKQVHKQRVQAAEIARQAKQQKAEEARRQQEEQDRAEREAIEREEWRQDILRRGDAASAKDHTDLFSTDEINQIINKYTANQRLNQLVEDAERKAAQQSQPQQQPQQNVQNQQQNNQNQQRPVAKTKTEKMINALNTIQKITDPVSKIASNANTIYNAYDNMFGDSKKQRAANSQKAVLEFNKANEKANNAQQNVNTAATVAKVVNGGIKNAANAVSRYEQNQQKNGSKGTQEVAQKPKEDLVAKYANYYKKNEYKDNERTKKYGEVADRYNSKKVKEFKDKGHSAEEIAKAISIPVEEVNEHLNPNSKLNQRLNKKVTGTYVQKPGSNQSNSNTSQNQTKSSTKETKKSLFGNKQTKTNNSSSTYVNKPSNASNSNDRAFENLQKMKKANSGNQKTVEQVSSMINKTNDSMLNKPSNKSNEKPVNKETKKQTSNQFLTKSSNDSYLSKQSTEALQIMKENLRDDIRSGSNKAYNQQQKVTLQDIEDILRERKKR